MILLAGGAQGQIDPEVQRLYKHAATRALQTLPQLELKATITTQFASGDFRGSPSTRAISLIVQQPSRTMISVQMSDGIRRYIAADGLVWMSDEYNREYGSRPGWLRPNSILLPRAARELIPLDTPLTFARFVGRQDARIDGEVFKCLTIEVAYSLFGGQTEKNLLWLDEATGVPLHQEIADAHYISTVKVIRLKTNGSPPAGSFERRPPKGFHENAAILDKMFGWRGEPTIRILTSDGKSFTSDDLLGQAGILVFDETGCEPCANEPYEFQIAATKLEVTGNKAFRVVTASSRADDRQTERVLSVPPEELDRLGIQVLPSTLVFGSDGHPTRLSPGFLKAEQLVQAAEASGERRPPSQGLGYVIEGEIGVTNPIPSPRVEPSLTQEERAIGVAGRVLLYVIVSRDGTVKNVSILRSLNPALDARAAETVRKWHFTPGTLKGASVDVATTISIEYR